MIIAISTTLIPTVLAERTAIWASVFPDSRRLFRALPYRFTSVHPPAPM